MCEGLRRQRFFEGSVPGADDDRFDLEDRFGGSVPGTDDDRFDPEDPFGGSVPGADDNTCDRDDRFGWVLPSAAKLYDAPAPISATVARAASGRSFLVMVRSFVW
jgi:hypothetical protein